MPTYRVPGTMTISVFVDVEADSIEEAKAKAEEASVMGLCHYCSDSRNREGEWCTSGELDGQPEINGEDEVIEL